YNFLNGHSASLSQGTLEKIAKALSLDAVNSLLVPAQPASADQALWRDVLATHRALPVTAETGGGRPAAARHSHPAGAASILVPRTLVPRQDGLFVVRVAAAGVGRAYPAGSLLVCAPPVPGDPILPAGCRVVLRIARGQGVIIDVCEVRHHRGHTLFQRLADGSADHQPALTQGPARGRTVTDGVSLLGRVVASWRPET
ncbi:MAG: hypothetical protein KGJ41_17495, partial [Rhodospirillales bacterium]|nr:hypothetical protein [Rhodospirillales bacterium]